MQEQGARLFDSLAIIAMVLFVGLYGFLSQTVQCACCRKYDLRLKRMQGQLEQQDGEVTVLGQLTPLRPAREDS
ncbi:hypothetical protein SS50377_25116 [Spironucleus salmonicida]|uniref:Uncharacterized protein n=1 Tax=Spironucleus salmonicida TaxID=348837 RepID=V6LJE2_9EUKA|nr:hypothetical protein SS50377_25116 [Spironucleus salmonicida]|eukprot:EST44700.1 Hypothetical protein SS50377_ee050 [Spironucleus salmonicida]